MKLLLVLTILTTAALLTAAGGPPAVTYIGHDKVANSLAKGGNLVTAPDLVVLGNHRVGAGEVEIHDKETDVFYVIDGSATFVTGGTIVGGKTTAPGQIRGTDMKGGETRQLSKGDVIVIPAGIPHWFKAIPDSISYYVVKVLKQ
jgi:mannose-6-phosphate isomerase-like protein (cupin superfamily)